jgi:hypothetical protein
MHTICLNEVMHYIAISVHKVSSQATPNRQSHSKDAGVSEIMRKNSNNRKNQKKQETF